MAVVAFERPIGLDKPTPWAASRTGVSTKFQSLWDGLEALIPAWERITSSTDDPHEIVRGKQGVLQSDVTQSFAAGTTRPVPCHDMGAGISNVQYGADQDFDLAGSKEITVACWANVQVSVRVSGRFIDNDGATTNSRGWSLLIGSDLNKTIALGINGDDANWKMESANDAVVVNEWRHYAARWHANKKADFFIDGKIFSTTATVMASAINGTAAGIRMRVNNNQAINRPNEMLFDIGYVWSRMLTDQEIGLLYAEPYGIITPSERSVFAFTAAAPGGISIPVVQHHRRMQRA